MAAISDSAYTPVFQNGQNQSLFGLQPSSTKAMSKSDIDHQQKLIQIQQQAMANIHLQQMGVPAIHVSQGMNHTSDMSSPQTVQLGSFSVSSESAADGANAVTSATTHINLSGTPGFSASLSSCEVSALNNQETDQRGSLLTPNAVSRATSAAVAESSAISPVPIVNLGVTVTAPSSIVSQGDGIGSVSSSENNLSMALGSDSGIATFGQLQQLVATSAGDLNVTTSAGYGLNGIVANPSSSSSTSLANISSIWSNPTGKMPSDDQANQTLLSEQALYQAFQQQQQQMSAAWANQQNAAALSGISNQTFSNPMSSPNMFSGNGLSNSAAAQQQAQLQELQQQLALRRSQAIQAMHAGLHRSTSFQPTSLGMPKGPGYSSWSNGQAALSNNGFTNSAMRSNSTLFNSLHHSNSPSGRVTTYNGATSSRKPSMGSHVISPPKFNRSFSTPVKYNGFGGSQISSLSSLEDNPFLKMSGDAQSRRGNMLSSLQETAPVDTMQMGTIETQLYDILRSETNTGGKWNEFGQDNLFEDSHLGSGSYDAITPNLNQMPPLLLNDYGRERYSRKVFVGGLPPDIDEEEIQASFRHFGPLLVDWPHKAESKSYFPPKGYAFLLFQSELSVQNLISCCMKNDDKLYLCLSSPTIKEKPVQIRPWNLADSDFVLDGSQPLDPRKTIFVGGVPRPLRAVELAMIMDRYYGGVCYAGIDVDPELKYPKGAGRVAFSNQQSYIAAINARFVQLQHGDIDKRVEVKPYVLDDQLCDECQGARCGGKFAPFFCASIHCLQYYCEQCWSIIHSQPGRELHKPLVKEGADRSPRSMAFRW